jgi:hypothetical protein
MENTLIQLLKKPVFTLSATEKNRCFKHIGVELLQGGGCLMGYTFLSTWLPKNTKLTFTFYSRARRFSINMNENIRSFNADFTMEQLEMTLREMNG